MSKFSKRGEVVRKFSGESSKKYGNFLISEKHSTENSGNSGMKVKWNVNFQEKFFENLGIPHEVVLFSGIYANSQFSTQR